MIVDRVNPSKVHARDKKFLFYRIIIFIDKETLIIHISCTLEKKHKTIAYLTLSR